MQSLHAKPELTCMQSCRTDHDTWYVSKMDNHGVCFCARHQLPELVINLRAQQPNIMILSLTWSCKVHAQEQVQDAMNVRCSLFADNASVDTSVFSSCSTRLKRGCSLGRAPLANMGSRYTHLRWIALRVCRPSDSTASRLSHTPDSSCAQHQQHIRCVSNVSGMLSLCRMQWLNTLQLA